MNQCGVPFMQADELRMTTERRRRFFPFVSAYVVAVPTYVGGFMTLGIASAAAWAPVDKLALARRVGMVAGQRRYWSPDVHEAAFRLPPYIAACLPAAASG